MSAPGWYPGRCKDCAEPALDGMQRCAVCRVAHNAREAKRRKARRKAGECTVCGAKAIVVDGWTLSTCETHREYYRARAAG
jgi:hypothetical protein